MLYKLNSIKYIEKVGDSLLEYILAKFLSDKNLKKSSFRLITKDGRKIEGKILSVSNGVVIVERKTEEKIVNEFVIVDKIIAIEIETKFLREQTKLIKKRIEKYFDEFEEFDKGESSIADLIECVGESEKESTITRYFLDGNHSIFIKVSDYQLITNEVSVFYFFDKCESDTQFNILLLTNNSINSIAIPEISVQLPNSKSRNFRYIKY